MTSAADDGALEIQRWTRYGKDRLYVSAADGTRVGWYDLDTGERHLEDARLAAKFATTIAAWLPTQPDADQESDLRLSGTPGHSDGGSSGPTDGTMSADTPSGSVVDVASAHGQAEVVEDDLAGNVPGQAAREAAETEWAALKDRSKLIAYGSRLFGAKTAERNWRVGADGEETIGARLKKLTPRGWYVLHAVPVGTRGSDIDHVLVGPGGVFTINTKNHPGGKIWVSSKTVMVNGHRTDYLRNSRHEAERASRLLTTQVGWDVPVRPALVLLTGTIVPDVTVRSRPDDVLILDRMDIPGAFKKARTQLAPELVEMVYAAARRRSTWQPR